MTVHTEIRHKSARTRFSADIAKVPPDGPSLQIWCRLYTFTKRRLELHDLKCFRIRGPLHVRVFRAAVSRGSQAYFQGVYVPLKLVLRYLVVTTIKTQTAM